MAGQRARRASASGTATPRAAAIVVVGFGLAAAIGLLRLGGPPATLALVPIAVDDAATVDEDAPPTPIDVLANDTALVMPNDNTIQSATDPPNGTVVVAPDNLSLTYEPDPDFHGEDTFEYTIQDGLLDIDTATVTVTVDPVNDPPVAADDPAPAPALYQLAEDTTFVHVGSGAGVLDNDTDIDGDPLTAVLEDDVDFGTLVLDPDGTFEYTPNPDLNSAELTTVTDAFTYHAFDGTDASNPITVRLNVTPINDPPTFLTDGDVSVDEDSGMASFVGWAVADVGPPDEEAVQSVAYVVTDVSVPGLFAVQPAVDPDGTLTFTPADDAHGSSTVTLHAQDDGGADEPGSGENDTSEPQVVTITIDPVNDDPTAVDDDATLDEDDPATAIDVLANDAIAPDADETLTISEVTQGTIGTVAITGGGTGLAYTPDPDAFGPDSFTYTIDDGNGGTDAATVTITIDPVNDDPTAVDDGSPDPIAIGQNLGPTAIDVLANDAIAPDAGETLTIIGVTQPAFGVVAITGGGTGLTYDPDDAYTGPDAFNYTIADGNGGTDTATVTIEVEPDTVGPDVSVRVAATRTPGSAFARVRVLWSATDDQAAIASYQLQWQTDLGAWVTIPLATPLTTQVSLVVPTGHGYAFRVRAKDEFTNQGAFATSPLLRL